MYPKYTRGAAEAHNLDEFGDTCTARDGNAANFLVLVLVLAYCRTNEDRGSQLVATAVALLMRG